MIRPITSSKIETVIIKKKKLPKIRSTESYGFIGKFYQIFRDELTLNLLNLFQKYL